jgi:hypothetical protein
MVSINRYDGPGIYQLAASFSLFSGRESWLMLAHAMYVPYWKTVRDTTDDRPDSRFRVATRTPSCALRSPAGRLSRYLLGNCAVRCSLVGGDAPAPRTARESSLAFPSYTFLPNHLADLASLISRPRDLRPPPGIGEPMASGFAGEAPFREAS